MLKPLRPNGSRQAVIGRASIPAPVEGWDTVSPLGDMGPQRAIVLDNFFPRDSYCELRRGFALYSTTPETSAVETVMAYHGTTSSADRLFSVANKKIFNSTSSGASGSAVVTGLTNSRLQYANFATAGGNFLYWVNGADAPQYWNGSVWTVPAITGATASSFSNINVYKNRLFFTSNGKLGFYYLPIASIAGAASYFELGGVFDGGGYLTAMGTWTVDGGNGVDDHAVFISSRGQIAVYTGTDPSAATSWSLVGVFDGAAPVGLRSTCKVGGDLAMITVEGVVPLSRSLILDKAALDNVAITKNITRAMNEAARDYGVNFGWQLIGYPKGTMAILNVPVAEGKLQYQYVMNTITGSWARFTGQNANCWEVFNDNAYFGGNDGKVYKADIQADDNGTPIVARMKTAFNYFGSRGVPKRFPMIQPLIVSDGLAVPAIKVNTDFNDIRPSASSGAGAVSNAAYWNQAYWNVNFWPGGTTVSSGWQSADAIGQCAAVQLEVVATSTTNAPIILQVNGFNLTMERGNYL